MSQFPFQRLQTELTALISSLPAESRLPSEPVLAKNFGVSRATLREAMRSFETQGLIRRKQGVGTFVIGEVPVLDSGLELLESIETLATRIGMNVSTGSLRIENKPVEAECAQELEIPFRTMVTQISRVIFTDDRPVAYLVDTLPETILSQEDLKNGFNGSVLDLLLRRGLPKLANSRTEIKAINAGSEIAKLLDIQRGDVLLLLRANLYDISGMVIDHSLSYFLPGYFSFHVNRRVG